MRVGLGFVVTGRNLCCGVHVFVDTFRKRVRRSLALFSLYEITGYNVEEW